jgi:hypothetical protein
VLIARGHVRAVDLLSGKPVPVRFVASITSPLAGAQGAATFLAGETVQGTIHDTQLELRWVLQHCLGQPCLGQCCLGQCCLVLAAGHDVKARPERLPDGLDTGLNLLQGGGWSPAARKRPSVLHHTKRRSANKKTGQNYLGCSPGVRPEGTSTPGPMRTAN